MRSADYRQCGCGTSVFRGTAAEAMRRILVDRARRKSSRKPGSGVEHRGIDEVEIAVPLGDEMLAVHDALDRLATYDARKAELVKLRYFAGLSFEEAAEVLGIVRTAARDWESRFGKTIPTFEGM